jgi:hypothetical protein
MMKFKKKMIIKIQERKAKKKNKTKHHFIE